MTVPIRTPAEALEAAAQAAASIGAMYASTAEKSIIGAEAIALCKSCAEVCANVAAAIRALPARIQPLPDDVAGLVAELLNRDEDWRRIAHGDFNPSIHKRAADMLQSQAARITALEAQVAAADGMAEALELCRPKTHAAMCLKPEYPWAPCTCGCNQPALAAHFATKESRK